MTNSSLPSTDAYAVELEAVLPADLPNRAAVVQQGAHHLALMAEVNETMNLTRIVQPREAAIKHVLDSVLPWITLDGFQRLLDIGSGAGFPGIPLSLAFPERSFTLAESIGKKARFIEHTIETLKLPNVDVEARRGEELLREKRFDATILRAVGNTAGLLKLIGPRMQNAGTLLLFKGPAGEEELAEAASEAKRLKLKGEVALRYELPDGAGTRTVLRYTPLGARR